MSAFVLLLLVAIYNDLGADGTMESIALFIKIKVNDYPVRIDLPAFTTLQDAIERLPLHYRGHFVSGLTIVRYQGQVIEPCIHLIDIGIGPDLHIELINPPDIELLFHLFDDNSDTAEVFGYETYEEFVDFVPEETNRKLHLENPVGILWGVSFTNNESGGVGDHVDGIYCLRNDHSTVSSWNWNIVHLFTALKSLQIQHTDIEGHVPFHKLPRTLEELNLANNCFSGPVPFSELPPNLEYLSLNGNDFWDTVHATALPRSLKHCYLDFADGDDGGGAQFKGEIKRSELPQGVQERMWSFRHGSLLIVKED